MNTIRLNYTMPETSSKKILIRGTNWIGDAVLTLPAVRAVRRAFPHAHIALLVKPWVAEIFQNDPYINEVILYEEGFNGLAGKFRLAGILRQKKFDTAILLQNAFDAALLAWLAGIPERVGYDRDYRGLLLTKRLPLSHDTLSRHQVHYYLGLLKSIGIETAETDPFIFLTDEEREWTRDLLDSKLPAADHKLLIGINPGATYGSAKRWPPERFAELIDRTINELDARVVIFGSEAEVAIVNEILLKLKTPDSKLQTHLLVMAGKTTLRQLASLISECDAMITNDSGPMHIASALFVPVVAIFGSTNQKATGPFGEGHKVITKGLPCSPCMKRECPEGHLKCMTEISSGDVFDALKKVLPRDRAVFLDRDGTLIEDKHYLNNFENLVMYPDAKEAMQALKDAGFLLIGMTNQSGIARGIVPEKFIIESNAYLQKELSIDDFYYCRHHPDDRCPCRKPEPMNVLKARLRHRLHLKTSYVIGDKELDVQLAVKSGASGILLTTEPPEITGAAFVANDLTEAVQWILKRESRTAGTSPH